MQAYDALGSGPWMVRMAQSLVRQIPGDSRFPDHWRMAIEPAGDADLPEEPESWLEVPAPHPTLAIGDLDPRLGELPLPVDPFEREAAGYPVYERLSFAFAGPR